MPRQPVPAVEAVRAFNRFYTRQIGVLEDGLLKTKYSLAEMRVLYELAHRDQPAASVLAEDLRLDPGYLSRILTKFRKLGFISRRPSVLDARQSLLSLTARGKAEFAKVNERSNKEMDEMLAPLSHAERTELVASMKTIERLLDSTRAKPAEPWMIRQPRVGDMGLVVSRQAAIYAQEYGWDQRFEALVAKIVAAFIEEFDPKRERCWIAEQGGEVIGSVFLVRNHDDENAAKLRMLYVESKARGMGVGNRLVEECIRFARECGYAKISLWTQSVLLPARRIYERQGFRLIQQQPHRDFGFDLIGENWELDL